jgi:hypothetical protein
MIARHGFDPEKVTTVRTTTKGERTCNDVQGVRDNLEAFLFAIF